ncbi:EscF/YscF/HrpA family type III secretion system needle major subunit [Propionivibrio soli]|uniref:EscF/YscF/HrpA family type III secretion system needle major subunit n=1 Tax=Propionivibrio soli TaxID=2976531 RepID=UPI0021E8E0C9|nr:EscF/YscF/HrpA family type III secretion system needle major subunit [Propionivibrio soli]
MITNGLSFDYIGTSVANVVENAETSLKNKISSLDADTASSTDLLLLQQEISKFTIMTEIQSTLVKELSDAMKGVIQKAG